MGNSASSSRNAHDETVDYGHLVPQGIYTGPRDWNEQIVAQAIVDRKLAPFYRRLEDYEEEEEWLDLQAIPKLERVVVLGEYSSDDDSESAQSDESESTLPPWHPFNLFK